jgi:hypothetical protein
MIELILYKNLTYIFVHKQILSHGIEKAAATARQVL